MSDNIMFSNKFDLYKTRFIKKEKTARSELDEMAHHFS